MTAVSLGYLTPDGTRVASSSWSIVANHVLHQAISALPEWDYAVDVLAQVEVNIDLEAALRDCGLGEGSTLRGLVTWVSTATRLRGGGSAVPLRDGANLLSVSIDGSQLGGDLLLEARIVLGPYPLCESELAPKRVGSTLWLTTHRVALEGGGSRFSTLPVSFSATGLAGGRRALWCLMADVEDLTASASNSFRVMLNTDNPRGTDLIQKAGTPEGRMFLEFVRFDVARQMLAVACEHEELDLDADYEVGSVGEALAGLVRRLFPQRSLKSLRSDYRLARGELEAELQAQIGLMS